VFGLLCTVDDSFGFILAYVPGFYAMRFLVFIWMFYPRANNGATTIYVAIKPLLRTVRDQFDAIFTPVRKSA
jgi:hypothetical protein